MILQIRQLSDIKQWVEEELQDTSFSLPQVEEISKKNIDQLLPKINSHTSEYYSVTQTCQVADLIFHEDQYQIHSQCALQQAIPNIGDCVVILHHPSIPFGMYGTITAINRKVLIVKVLLFEMPYYKPEFKRFIGKHV